MQDNRDDAVDPIQEPNDDESAAGEVTTPGRFTIGARARLLLGLAAMGVMGAMAAGAPFPTVSKV